MRLGQPRTRYTCSHCGEQGHGVTVCTALVSRETAAWRAFDARREHGEGSKQYRDALQVLAEAHRRMGAA